MIDLQPLPSPSPSPVIPGVYGPAVAVATAAGTLARSSGTALHVERDAGYILACRVLVGTCTREEWDRPEHRRATIALAWKRAAEALRVEDEELITAAPLTLYRDYRTNKVICADVSLPGKPQRLITPDGRPAVASAADLALTYRVERTTYAHWAEGPLPHLNLDMRAAKTPDTDRDLQYLRHQNRDLMALFDASLSPSEWAPEAHTLGDDGGLVDFRLRGIVRRREYHQLVSKQTGEASVTLFSDGSRAEIPQAATAAPTTEAALDALLESN